MTTVDVLEGIPTEIITSLKLLSDDTRLSIVLTLLKNGDRSFSELSDDLKISKNILSHHLKALTQAALIKNYYDKKEGRNDYSFYEPTTLSRDFVDKLFGVMEPSKSSTETLSNIFAACKNYAMGFERFSKTMQDYMPESTVEFLKTQALVKNQILKIEEFPKKSRLLMVEAK